MDKKTIFFSYGHDEYKEFVLKIRDYLTEAGYSVFVDSDKLRSGDDWEYKLEQGIQKRDKVVFFITPHSARRPNGYCLNEVAMALARGKKVFPIMIEKHILPLSLIRKQFLDMQKCVKKENSDDGIFKEKMDELFQALENDDDFEHGDIQVKLLNKLDPIDFQLNYKMHGNIIGRKWVLDKVDDWLDKNTTSKVLWITAKAGYGKSAISSYLSTHPNVIDVHFCSYNNPVRNRPENLIKTLAYNLSNMNIEGYREAIEDIEINNKTAFELFEQLIANPLSNVKKKDSNYILVIDGLDETLEDEKQELLNLLASDEFFWGLPGFLKIIITSRPEPEINQILSRYETLVLNAEEEDNHKDCELYIKRELKNKGLEDSKKLISSIMEKSDANMLYLKTLFEDDSIDYANLGSLPRGLNGIYRRFFERLVRNQKQYYAEMAPIIEVMLAYFGPVPKLLLKDILNYSSTDLDLLLNQFGSMMYETDEGYLDFYHKSLWDWFVAKDNTKYKVDLEEGLKKIDIFMQGLTVDNYKEAYMNYGFLNDDLVDSIYLKNKNLNNYFLLLVNINSIENKIAMLNSIWHYSYNDYHYDKSLILQKEVNGILAQLYEENNDLWVEQYSISLSRLVVNYSQINNTRLAKKFSNINYKIVKYYYKYESRKWAERYIAILRFEANSSSEQGNHETAIELYNDSLNIIKPLYAGNDKLWIKSYLSVVNALSLEYRKIGRLNDAIKLSEEGVEILQSLYHEEQSQNELIDIYLQILKALATYHIQSGELDNAKKILYKNLDVAETAFYDDSKLWISEYISALDMITTYYSDNDKLIQSCNLQEEYCRVLEINYENDSLKWIEKYSTIMMSLSSTYIKMEKLFKAKKLLKKNLNIIEKKYKDNPDQWLKMYIKSLNKLASTFVKLEEYDDAVLLHENILGILKPLYNNNVDMWAMEYILALQSFSSVYISSNEPKDAIKLDRESLKILTPLYQNDKARWVELYSILLNKLSIIYFDAFKKKKAIALAKENYEILTPLYEKDSIRWNNLYTQAFDNLTSYYTRTGNFKEVSLLFDERYLGKKRPLVKDGLWGKIQKALFGK